MNQVAERFKRDTARHVMTVAHDVGLYRHVQFAEPGVGMYWFELITVPGALIFRGDGESFVFSRLTDMFEFFRGSAWQGKPNLGYWREKVTSDPARIERYDREILEARIKQAVAEYYEGKTVPAGLDACIRSEVLAELVGEEAYDRRLVDEFEFYVDGYDPAKEPDFQFEDHWEWQVWDWSWWYVWACHAIVWGIARYDEAKGARP